MDAFLGMLPEAYLDHPDGLTFKTVYEDGKPLVVIGGGPVAKRAFRGMRHAVAALAGQGNNLILDDVLLEGAGAAYAEYVDLLAAFEIFTVGIHAPLDVLEARERRRGDRLIGLARWQYGRVHRGMTYDFDVDANAATPAECAALIKKRFGL